MPAPRVPSAESLRLAQHLRRAGLMIALGWAMLIPLAFGLASHTPLEYRQEREVAFFRRMVEALPIPGGALRERLVDFTEGESRIFRSREARAATYLIPLAIVTLGFLVGLGQLLRAPQAVTPETVTLLYRYSVGFALINILIYPMFTSDFWLSTVWGRMLLEGINPYYATFTSTALANLPIADFGEKMTYGPLWAYISAIVEWLAHGSALASFLLGKALLAAAWIGSVWWVRRSAESISPFHAAVSVCLFGWMPMSVSYAVGEGHNDAVTVACLCLWLYLTVQNRHLLAPLALTASMLIKYITAPLFALEALGAVFIRRIDWRNYGLILCSAVMLVAAAFLPLVRDRAFFEAAQRMQEWEFWTPANAAQQAGLLFGFHTHRNWLFLLTLLVGLAVTARYTLRYVRERDLVSYAKVAMAMMATVLFVVVGHVWPWFVLWILPLAALAWPSRGARFLLTFALLVPSWNLLWMVQRDWTLREPVGLATYGLATVLCLASGRWFRSSPA